MDYWTSSWKTVFELLPGSNKIASSRDNDEPGITNHLIRNKETN